MMDDPYPIAYGSIAYQADKPPSVSSFFKKSIHPPHFDSTDRYWDC